MITASLILLAAFFKSVADTLLHHFDSSVFRRKNINWWDPAHSWEHVNLVRGTGYRPDAWHLANSGMIISFICAIAIHDLPLKWYWQIPIDGWEFDFVFGIFYSKILRKKT